MPSPWIERPASATNGAQAADRHAGREGDLSRKFRSSHLPMGVRHPPLAIRSMSFGACDARTTTSTASGALYPHCSHAARRSEGLRGLPHSSPARAAWGVRECILLLGREIGFPGEIAEDLLDARGAAEGVRLGRVDLALADDDELVDLRVRAGDVDGRGRARDKQRGGEKQGAYQGEAASEGVEIRHGPGTYHPAAAYRDPTRTSPRAPARSRPGRPRPRARYSLRHWAVRPPSPS